MSIDKNALWRLDVRPTSLGKLNSFWEFYHIYSFICVKSKKKCWWSFLFQQFSKGTEYINFSWCSYLDIQFLEDIEIHIFFNYHADFLPYIYVKATKSLYELSGSMGPGGPPATISVQFCLIPMLVHMLDLHLSLGFCIGAEQKCGCPLGIFSCDSLDHSMMMPVNYFGSWCPIMSYMPNTLNWWKNFPEDKPVQTLSDLL